MGDEMNNGLGGLGGLQDFGGLSSEESVHQRDAANLAGLDLDETDYSSDAPQSLSDFATQGMGEGLSAMKADLGLDNGGIELSAALEDEEDEMVIHAALEDEEEEEPIRAGRVEEEDVQAGMAPDYSEGGQNFDRYNHMGDSKLASQPSQNIDGIFIGGNYNGSSDGERKSTGGTMYDPSKQKTNVNVSFGMPPFLKNIIIFACILGILYVVLEFGFHVKLENYWKPVDVQEYVDTDPATLSSKLGLKFKDDKETYSSSTYEYFYDINEAGGLKLVNYSGKRIFIEVTGTRIDYSIYGIRPQFTSYTKARAMLTSKGFSEVEKYEEVEELGAQGEEHCFYNSTTGEGVIIGKKTQYKAVKAVKYMKNYKKYAKLRKQLRSE